MLCSKAPTRKITSDGAGGKGGGRGKAAAKPQAISSDSPSQASFQASGRGPDASMVRQQSRNIALGRAESITPRGGRAGEVQHSMNL